MVHVYYHYNNGRSVRGSHCKTFATRGDASRWAYYMGMKYPKFQLDEVFDESSTTKNQ
jgi:hypothetical protein